jgi:lathosterol oxidase
MHPFEFFIITGGVQFIVFFFPIHLVPLLVNFIYIAVHAVKDHSGIDFDGDFPWQATARFHDDHHKYFHCNFGQSLLCWDMWCGTLRKQTRKYGENVFYGRGEEKFKDSSTKEGDFVRRRMSNFAPWEGHLNEDRPCKTSSESES